MSRLSYGEYGETENFPKRTNPEPGILEPLRLPEKENTPIFEEQEIICLLCDDNYTLPSQQKDFLKHLLSEHKFVISDVNMISDLAAYIRYWKNKFRSFSLTAYCTVMKADISLDSKKEKESKEEEFFFLSDIVPEDKELRMQLQRDTLEKVLAVQESERNDSNLNKPRGCLFCRKNFSPRELFHHMKSDHNFNFGHPDNLVFINQFLDVIENKLENLLCLHCEKTFVSREALKEHMRKKFHKQLNPNNKEYDRFYMVNYLEFGKNWEDAAREGYEDELPSGWDSDREDGGDWSDWRGDLGGAICLFCPVNYEDTVDLLEHMKQVHGFDFHHLRSELKLNFYQQVKLVNYIRRQVHLNTCMGCHQVFDSKEELLEHMTWGNHMEPSSSTDWDQPQYYFPTYENDNLLCGLEDLNKDGSSIDTDDTGFCSEDSQGGVTIVPEEFPVGESILAQEEFRRSLLPPGKRYYNPRSKSRDTRELPK